MDDSLTLAPRTVMSPSIELVVVDGLHCAGPAGAARGGVPAAGVEARCATQVLIVDDCALYRECLVGVLTRQPGAVIPTVAWDAASVTAELGTARPDVILLNMATYDRSALLRRMLRFNPDSRVVVIGVCEDDEAGIVECAENGVVGYHLRTESLDDLLTLIEHVAAGQSSCSPRVSEILLRRLSALAAQRQPVARDVVLTVREIEILRMLEMGLANRDIADQLCIAVHTVKNHVHSVLSKLGVSSREQAGAMARNMSAASAPQAD